VERSFALSKLSGNLGRMTIRGLENVTKRYLIHAAAYNLGLVMRAIFGQGTPKGMADALGRLIIRFFWPLGSSSRHDYASKSRSDGCFHLLSIFSDCRNQ
jgi:hypothetical protein